MKCFSDKAFTLLYYEILLTFLQNPPALLDSRIGPYRDLGPAVIDVPRFESRWCLLPKRAINPFFALQEISWILTGANAVAPLSFFIKDFGKFSDDGVTLEGAYGHRLRFHHGVDQLKQAISLLSAKPSDRRVCLVLWDISDLGKVSRDIPCNIFITLKVRDNYLDISVMNRSNDAYLGVPYNVMQFHGIQAYIAQGLGIACGRQVHFTDSLHVYETDMAEIKQIVDGTARDALVSLCDRITKSPLSNYVVRDHQALCDDPAQPLLGDDEFTIIRNAYLAWKRGDSGEFMSALPATEAGLAAALWFLSKRRLKGYAKFPHWLHEFV